MKLWHISQTARAAYDTFDSAIVAAETEEDARNTHPSDDSLWSDKSNKESRWRRSSLSFTWCECPDQVAVRLVGDAVEGTERGVICASFNAG